jgi:hypothetical protein
MKKCPSCSGEINEESGKCTHCGVIISGMGEEDSNDDKKEHKIFGINKGKAAAGGGILILVIILSSLLYLNSQIKQLKLGNEGRLSQKTIPPEETAVREAFDKAMNFRLVANCDSFADSVSKSDEKAREEWGERCRKEKMNEAPAISNIEISRLSIKDDKAFIQANLTREIDLGENITYTGTYELKLEDGQWKLLTPKD